jgi:hypothetical protein
VRDARPARIRRTPDRDHAGRSRTRRILGQSRTDAGHPNRRGGRRTGPGTADSGRSGDRGLP